MKKKIIVVSTFIVIIMAIVVLIIYDMTISYNNCFDIENLSVLINHNDLNEKNGHNVASEIYTADILNADFKKKETFNKEKSIALSLQLTDGSMCIVKQEEENVIISITTKLNTVENELILAWLPDDIFEYNHGILLKHGADLYFWQCNEGDEIIKTDISDKYSAEDLFAYKNNIAFSKENFLYLYVSGKERILKEKAQCLGFYDDKTLFFAKDLSFGYVLLYRYNIDKDSHYGYRILHIPGYIIYKTTFSPDGKYMIYFSSDGEGGIAAYILDLKYYKHKKLNLEVDSIKSVQWLKEM